MKKKYGEYNIVSELGHGANGVVYECTNEKGKKFAIKVLRKNKRKDEKGIKRFKNEIKILNKEKNNTGILPIIDYSDDKEYWYVMPIATPISSVINTLTNEKIIAHIYRLSKVLIDLHKKGVFHRDIKPENLFLYNENIVLSDFGMVHFPDGYFVTKENDKIFPNPIFAPEMNNIPKIIDYSKVDVYSLAKTFWCLLTQSNDAFAGVYSVNDEMMNIEIKAMEKIENPGWLHTLFEKSTTTNPKERIDMQEFSKIIHKNCYLGTPKVYNNWTMNWKSICDRLICSSLPNPKSILWDKIEDIRLILNEVYKFKNTCNTIFSNGGDMPFEGDIAIEDGRLVFKVLDRNKFFYTIKPKCLLFIPINNNPCYNFFGLRQMEMMSCIQSTSQMALRSL